MLTVKLLQKDYSHLATCLVPIGSQIGMSQQEIADMLRTKTRRFTEKDIACKFKPSKGISSAKKWSGKPWTMDGMLGVAGLRLRAAAESCED